MLRRLKHDFKLEDLMPASQAELQAILEEELADPRTAKAPLSLVGFCDTIAVSYDANKDNPGDSVRGMAEFYNISTDLVYDVIKHTVPHES